MFNYLIFDLDNTIFSYDNSHNKALNEVFIYIEKEFNIKYDIIEITFINEKDKYKNTCYNKASSHSKYIQFKKLLEKLKINIEYLDKIYSIYEKTFISNLEIYEDALDFLEFCFNQNIQLYILSNNLCKFQINILKNLKIDKFFKKIYTTEEYDTEKPDPKLYYSIIDDINCNKDEIAMIGDNLKNDIKAANDINIYAFYFKNNLKQNKVCIKEYNTVYTSYKELLEFFKGYYENIKDYITISNSIGERFDLVQAGGGNTSIKIDDIIYIKSSGCNLTELDLNKNYIGLKYKNINNKLALLKDEKKEIIEKESNNIINNNIIFLKRYKPSIETTLHCITPYKYTIHIHSIQFNRISALPNCKNILSNIFNKFFYLEYTTPGIKIYFKMLNRYKDENIIFLKNHGIVITGDKIEEIYNILNNTINKLEEYTKKSMNKYKYVNKISTAMSKINNSKFITKYIDDIEINKFLTNNNSITLKHLYPFFPDKVVYAGIGAIYIKNNNIEEIIKEYINEYKELPKIFIKDNKMYITSNSLKKCNDIESIIKAHLLCVNNDNEYLENKEIKYLNNWDAEKYRKDI